MIINRITLKNFGIYYGECSIDMQVQESKNIVLLGGKNGSGKTTLLNALRTVLYGSQIYGAKTATERYLEYIREKFNLKALKEGQNECFIEINFDLHEDGVYNKYQMKRVWQIDAERSTKVTEDLTILKNSKELGKDAVEDLENYFRTFMPKEIFDFFFFDGEKIKELIENEDLNDILKKEILTLFNLDIFDMLKEDIGRYAKWKEKKNKATEEEIRIGELREDIEHIDNFSVSLERDIIQSEDSLSTAKLKLDDLRDDFYNKGGLNESEIIDLRNKEEALVENDGVNQRRLSEFSGNILPFLMLQGEVSKLEKRLEKERNKEAYELVMNRIDINSLIAHLLKRE